MRVKAFTLIELLVVISIIAFLSSVVLASLSSAREKAQIASFKQYLQQARNAIELYYADNNSYPSNNIVWSNITSETGALNGYIEFQDIPTLLKNDSVWYLYIDRTAGSVFSCDKSGTSSEDDPWMIGIRFEQTDLDFPRVYTTGPWGNNNYCISPTVSP